MSVRDQQRRIAFKYALCTLLLLSCSNGNNFVSVGKGKAGTGGGDRSDASAEGGTKSSGGKAGKGGGGSSGGDGNSIGNKDGGLAFDAAGATMDAAALGLDGSLALPDGSWILADGAIVLPDGEIIDVDAAIKRYAPELDVTSCNISASDTFSTKVDFGDEGGFALVAGQTGFGLAFQGIGSTSCAQEADVMHIPASHGFPTPRSILADCTRITDIALLGRSDGWQLAWVDNLTNMAELHTLALDLDMNVPSGGMRRQLTDNQLQAEQKPALAEIAGQPIVAWITDDLNVSPDQYRISTKRLDGDAQAIDVVKEVEGHVPQALALSPMGMSAAAIGWVEPLANPGVWLLELDATGAAVDAPIQLTDKVAVSSSIALAGRVNGGAAVYSIEIDGNPQVRFRRLDENGAPLAVERPIVGPPLRAQGASIAALGGGYAIAYRALPGGAIKEPEVRLTFVTKEGNVIRDANGQLVSFPIGPATLADGRTDVSVSVEGEVMVAWIDADPSSGKNVLEVARHRLDCH